MVQFAHRYESMSTGDNRAMDYRYIRVSVIAPPMTLIGNYISLVTHLKIVSSRTPGPLAELDGSVRARNSQGGLVIF